MHQPILSPPCTIYLVRHGETDNNKNKILQGDKVDMSLNKTGVQQANQAAQRLKQVKFDMAFSSDLIRAKKTADIIALQHKLTVTTHQALRERSFGQFEGKPETEMRRKLKRVLDEFESLSDEAKFNYQFPNGIENFESCVTRLINFLRQISIAYSGKTVLVVTHGSIMRFLLIRLGFAAHDQLPIYPVYAIANLGHLVLESDGLDLIIKDTYGITVNK